MAPVTTTAPTRWSGVGIPGRRERDTQQGGDWRSGGWEGDKAERGGGPKGRRVETRGQQARGSGSRACTGSLPFLAPTGSGPVFCLSSSEEEAVHEEEEAHLRLVVLGMLQLSRYLATHQRT